MEIEQVLDNRLLSSISAIKPPVFKRNRRQSVQFKCKNIPQIGPLRCWHAPLPNRYHPVPSRTPASVTTEKYAAPDASQNACRPPALRSPNVSWRTHGFIAYAATPDNGTYTPMAMANFRRFRALEKGAGFPLQRNGFGTRGVHGRNVAAHFSWHFRCTHACF